MRVVATDFMAPRQKMARRYGAAGAGADSAEVAKVIRGHRGRGLDAAVVAVPVEAAVQQAQARCAVAGRFCSCSYSARRTGPVGTRIFAWTKRT